MNRQLRIVSMLLLASMVSSIVRAQSTSLLLEEGIYTEQTLGDLGVAIKIYQQVIADARSSRSTAALALFRIGMCYQKSGQKNLAQNTFAQLAKSYPEQQDLLRKIPVSVVALQVKPAPWVDGEVLKTVVSDQNGMVLMRNEYRTESVPERNQWHLQKISVGLAGTFQYTSIRADNRDMTPISCQTKMKGLVYGEYDNSQTIYAPDHVISSKTTSGKVKARRSSLRSPTYDYEGVVQLIRCLALAEDFEVAIPAFVVSLESLFDEKIKVVGRETVTVPAGTFDCYRVAVSDQNIDRDRECWISMDSHSYPVKSTFANTIEVLESVTTADGDRTVSFQDSLTGVSLSAPPAWVIKGFDLNVAVRILITDPELNCEGEIWVENRHESKPVELSPARQANAFQYDKSKVKEFAVRTGSQDTTPISGLHSLRWIVDYLDPRDGHRIVACRAIVLSATKEYSLEFRSDATDFNQLRATLDSIILSLRLR